MYLVFSFCDGLAYGLHDSLELLCGARDTGLDELDFWSNEVLHFLHGGLVFGDIADSLRRVGMFPDQVVFTCYRLEYHGEMARKVGTSHKQGW